MQGPGGFVLTFPLEDDGYGYPDVTGSDGIYTGTLPKFSHQPGKHSSLSLITAQQTAFQLFLVTAHKNSMIQIY